jgi:streptomycin 6-kinase
VLKLAEPGSLDAAARVMIAANGRGYAAVLAWSAEAGALLIEMLGEHLWSERSTVAGQSEIVVPLLRDAWDVPLDEGSPFERKTDGLSRILADLGPRYGTHHQPAVDQAAIYARELATDEKAEVVCHGDPHAGNVLRRADSWALIDPDGFVGERSYDVGVVLRDGCREITSAEAAQRGKGTVLLRQACRHAAELAGVDAERVWRWAYVERVTTGLYLHWHGYPAEATSFLDSALLIDVGRGA